MERIDDAPAGAFSWSVHPARRHPWSLAFAFAVALGVSVLMARLTREVWIGSLFFGTLLFVMRGFLLETRTTLDDEGVTVDCWPIEKRLPWADVKRAEVDGDAVILLRGAGANAYRGISLALPPDRERVLRTVRRNLPPRVRLVE